MKSFLAFALIFSISTLGMVGCTEKVEEKKTTEVTTPTGSDKKVETIKDEKTGDAKDKP